VLRRYEQLLGVAPSHLIAVADWAYRKASHLAGPPVLDRGLDPANPQVNDRTGQLLDQALSADLMTGPDWAELTSHLAILPAAFLYPRASWADLAERLLAELLIADGTAWLSRTEGLARLIAHPRGRPPIIAACAALVADPASQLVIEPLAIFDLTAKRDINQHMLAQLVHLASRRAPGRALAVGEKDPRWRLRPAQSRGLADTATDLITMTDPHNEARHLAAELLRRAATGQLGPACDRLRRAIGPTTQSLLIRAQPSIPATATQVIARVLAATIARMPRQPPAHTDPMLSRLLGDLLFSPNQNQRLIAGQFIAATPYREPVGAALAAELATAPAAHTVALTTALLAAIPFVGHPADRPIVERFVTAAGLAAPITDTAAWTIGHIPGHSDEQFWLTAIEIHVRAWQHTRNPTSISALRGLTHALGIGCHHDLLRTFCADTRLPAPARVAVDWWLNMPARIHASAAQ